MAEPTAPFCSSPQLPSFPGVAKEPGNKHKHQLIRVATNPKDPNHRTSEDDEGVYNHRNKTQSI